MSDIYEVPAARPSSLAVHEGDVYVDDFGHRFIIVDGGEMGLACAFCGDSADGPTAFYHGSADGQPDTICRHCFPAVEGVGA